MKPVSLNLQTGSDFRQLASTCPESRVVNPNLQSLVLYRDNILYPVNTQQAILLLRHLIASKQPRRLGLIWSVSENLIDLNHIPRIDYSVG